jgi:hypothetical protein
MTMKPTQLALCAAFGLLAPYASAQQIPATVVASIHDEPIDGLGDTFNSAPFQGLLRKQATRQDRAILEYDLAAFVGSAVPSVTLSGRVSVNNASDNGPRLFDFQVYSGNGAADLSDFQIVATLVGSGAYAPPTDSFFDFSFDVTAAVQAVLSSGNGWIGVRCDPTSEPNFPSILSADTVLTVGSGGPGTAYCFGDGSGTPCPCGNPGSPGRGCANSTASGGALLEGAGSSSVGAANLVLVGSGAQPNQPGLFFQGNNATSGGSGFHNGDGLRCAGGGIRRLQIVTANPVGSSMTTVDIAALGLVAPGDTKRYQWWYRNPSPAAPCGTTFNLSNGLEVLWAP